MWTRIASEKITGDYDKLEMHRAARNVMLLLTRIADFEKRAEAARGGELDDADRQAIARCLLTLVDHAAPLVPHIAGELRAPPRLDA